MWGFFLLKYIWYLYQNIKIVPYISITGLKPKGFFRAIQFWLLAIPSFDQARKSKGNQFCETKRINNYQCTLTAWDSRARIFSLSCAYKSYESLS